MCGPSGSAFMLANGVSSDTPSPSPLPQRAAGAAGPVCPWLATASSLFRSLFRSLSRPIIRSLFRSVFGLVSPSERRGAPCCSTPCSCATLCPEVLAALSPACAGLSAGRPEAKAWPKAMAWPEAKAWPEASAWPEAKVWGVGMEEGLPDCSRSIERECRRLGLGCCRSTATLPPSDRCAGVQVRRCVAPDRLSRGTPKWESDGAWLPAAWSLDCT